MSNFLDKEAFEARSNSQEDSEGSDEIPITTSRSKKPKRALAALFSTDSGGSSSVSESEAERVNLSKRAKVLKCKKRSQEGESSIILSELKKTNNILRGLDDRLMKMEKRVKMIEESRSTSACSTPKSSRNKDVPQEVRVRINLALNSCIRGLSQIEFDHS